MMWQVSKDSLILSRKQANVSSPYPKRTCLGYVLSADICCAISSRDLWLTDQRSQLLLSHTFRRDRHHGHIPLYASPLPRPRRLDTNSTGTSRHGNLRRPQGRCLPRLFHLPCGHSGPSPAPFLRWNHVRSLVRNLPCHPSLSFANSSAYISQSDM